MICDLAETYGIFNYQELPPSLVATLVVGLRDDSRVKMTLSGTKLTLDQTMLALILDGINLILWGRSKKHSAKPKSAYKILTEEKKPKDELKMFRSPEEYEAWAKRKREVWDNG